LRETFIKNFATTPNGASSPSQFSGKHFPSFFDEYDNEHTNIQASPVRRSNESGPESRKDFLGDQTSNILQGVTPPKLER
jgi:hypothetical protein